LFSLFGILTRFGKEDGHFPFVDPVSESSLVVSIGRATHLLLRYICEIASLETGELLHVEYILGGMKVRLSTVYYKTIQEIHDPKFYFDVGQVAGSLVLG
jgi:hypothetical protein